MNESKSAGAELPWLARSTQSVTRFIFTWTRNSRTRFTPFVFQWRTDASTVSGKGEDGVIYNPVFLRRRFSLPFPSHGLNTSG
jgi:hypothetical protein